MAFDRFNDKPPRRDNRPSGKGGRFSAEPGRKPYEKPFGKPFGKSFGKPFARPFKEELGGRSGPRAWAVDKRRFSDRSAYVQNAMVRLDADVAQYFKTAEDVNAALRLVIALSKTVKAPHEAPEEKPLEPQTAEAATPQADAGSDAAGES